MSYNYDQCVQAIQGHRRRAYANDSNGSGVLAAESAPDLEVLQESMDGFATLSKHCPMTPLLWMQYAHDTEVLMEGLMMLESSSVGDGNERQLQMQAKKGALESSTGILELALAEYPGCALLQLYFLESLADYVYQCEGLHQLNVHNGTVGMDDRQVTISRLTTAFDAAWKSVGRGTHVNEGMIVSEIYRLHGSFLLFRLSSVVADTKDDGMKDESETNNILQQMVNLFQHWSKTPMGEGSNDEMMQDMEYLWDGACSLLLSSCDGEDQKLEQGKDLGQKKSALWADIDEERKRTSPLTNILSSNENEIDVAMSNEGIALPRCSLFSQQQDEKMMDSTDNDIGRYAQSLKRNNPKWNQILVADTNRFLLGGGGRETSRAFSKPANGLQKIHQDMAKKGGKAAKSILGEYVATYGYSLIASMYERAVSECPTVESVWISYMNFLKAEWIRVRNEMQGKNQGPDYQIMWNELTSALQSTSQRAIRNCPYSSALFEIRMNTLGSTSMSNLEPDDITAIIQEATELGFLNHNREAMLHLRLVAILVVKRRLLSLVSLGTTATVNGLGKEYDEGEEVGSLSSIGKKKQTKGAIMYNSLDPNVMEEVQDLLEDIRDMYDEADTFLFKSHSTWAEGKVSFWKHRALTEAYTLCPIRLALRKASDEGMTEENGGEAGNEAMNCYEKLVKAQKPSHPDSWREYIQYISTSHQYLMADASNSNQSQPDSIAAAVSTLRKTRGLYHRAMMSMKKAGLEETSTTVSVESKETWIGRGMDTTMFQRNYDTALSDLCREYLEFERTAGSEESFSHAQTLVRNKLLNWDPQSTPALNMATTVPNNQEESFGKRKLSANDSPSAEANGPSVMTESHGKHDEEEVDNQSQPKRVKVQTNLKQPKKTDGVHKIRIGKMEYPAHPYTIHVSNLNKETQEMELVDVFRPEFGAIVHAKVLREKRTGKGGHHFHGESKCAGLIQFEERLSVEKSLQNDGKVKVGGKMVKIQRSHVPAVGVVPAGMHRVNPRGEGKMSKRNKFHKESKLKVNTNDGMDVEEKKGKAEGNAMKAGHSKGKKKNSEALTSPSSISLGVLSFKPRGMRQKPKISLEPNKKQG